MTQKQFTTYKYRSFEEVNVNTNYGVLAGMILGIDFGKSEFHIRFFPLDGYEFDEIWVSYHFVNKPGSEKPANMPIFMVKK